jgi:hypothetical protein
MLQLELLRLRQIYYLIFTILVFGAHALRSLIHGLLVVETLKKVGLPL